MDKTRLNKKALARLVARRSGLQIGETKRCLDALIEVFAETIEAGGEIALQGMGTFQVYELSERLTYNPGTNTHMVVPVHKRVRFLPSALIKL